MNSITVTTATAAANDITTRQSVTTEVIENRHVFLEDAANDSATFTEWENVPASLQEEMAKCIQEINQATARLQGLILRSSRAGDC